MFRNGFIVVPDDRKDSGSARLAARGVVCVIMAALSATTLAAPAWSVDIKVTGHAGAQVDRGNGWEAAQDDMVLSTCHKIRLPGSYSWLTWQRIGGCGNTGTVETGLSKIKEYHVGTDVPFGNAPTTLLQGGFMDLLAGGATTGSDATLYESEGCYGNWHCGFNVGFAACAAMDPTPPGLRTVFSGCHAIANDNQHVATFYNHPQSRIPVYIETFADQGLHSLPPGWWAQVFPNGQVNAAPGSPPPCGNEPTNSVPDAWLASEAPITAIPNPLQRSTRIHIPKNSGVEAISILDASGREVSVLRVDESGSAEWSARDGDGTPLPSGVYFARIQEPGARRSRALPLIVIR